MGTQRCCGKDEGGTATPDQGDNMNEAWKQSPGCEGSHHEQCDVKFEAGSGEKPGRKGTGATS